VLLGLSTLEASVGRWFDLLLFHQPGNSFRDLLVLMYVLPVLLCLVDLFVLLGLCTLSAVVGRWFDLLSFHQPGESFRDLLVLL
jgi:hypothetical protein